MTTAGIRGTQWIQDFQQRRLPCRRFAGVGARSAQSLDLLGLVDVTQFAIVPLFEE